MSASWPFSTVADFTFNSGVGQAVPTIIGTVTVEDCHLVGAHFTNNGVASSIVTVTNLAGDILCKVKIPAGSEQPYEWVFRPTVGVRWVASVAGVLGHMWGYTP